MTKEVDQLMAQIAALAPDQRNELRGRLGASPITLPLGTPGSELVKFFGILDDESAKEMMAAIEEGCEQIDYGEW